MGIENYANAVRALSHLKDDLHITPEIVVHDLSPNLLSATAEVYGADKIALDPFHVMQNVNRAILKDLGRFRKRHFTAEKKELDALTNCIKNWQKPSPSSAPPTVNDTPKCEDSHEFASQCRKITMEMLQIWAISRPKAFFAKLKPQLSVYHIQTQSLPLMAFGWSLEDHLPLSAETGKAMIRMKAEILKKLKTFYRECQRPLKVAQRRFNKSRWLLFYQPNHMTPQRAIGVTRFLRQYPELQQYRDLTLSCGSIYRLPIGFLHPNLLEEILIRSDWGDELKACMSTLKRYSAGVFRFKAFFEQHPEVPKKCRANMEYQNVTFHRVFQAGFYMKGMNRIEKEIGQHLGGEVRNFLNVA